MIYVDISAAVHSRAGLGRYAESLAQSLIEIDPDRYALFYNKAKDGSIQERFESVPQRSVKLGYKPWRMLLYLANLSRISFKPLFPDLELFHSTEHLLMPIRDVPTVLTVHDLIFKLYPDYHKRMNYWYLNQAMPLFCRRASSIIAVSEATKQDIVEYFGIDASKIHVVHEAAAEHFKPPSAADISLVRRKYELPDQFLLHLSTVEPRKNLDRLVDALLILREEIPDLTLILVGGWGWLCDDFFQRIESDQLSGIVRSLGWVSDEDLPAVIGAAALAVQPSLYEGFGLPILEHMACGQVVAASDRSSHPEVGGEASAYFDPEEVEQMVGTIKRLLQNQDEYQRRRDLSLVQAGKFSWHNSAVETIEVYDQLIKRSKNRESAESAN
jgi:glycosyltransferase involved in cell wall biosynthesis